MQGRDRNVALRVFKEGSHVHKYSPDREALEGLVPESGCGHFSCKLCDTVVGSTDSMTLLGYYLASSLNFPPTALCCLSGTEVGGGGPIASP